MQDKQNGFRRLALVVGLLLLPICILGYLFVMQAQKDIAFARKEIAGVRYLEAVMPLFEALALGTSASDLSQFEGAAAAYDPMMKSQRHSKALLEALQGASPQAKALDTVRDLFVQVGDQSNLILDPDLDSYYLMDLVVMRLPETLMLSRQLADRLAPLKTKPRLSGEDEAALLLLAGQLEAARGGAARSFAAAFTANADGSVRKALAPTAIDFGSQLGGFVTSSQAELQSYLRPLQTPFPAYEPIAAQHERLIAETGKAWRLAAAELLRLLEARADKMMGRLSIALGASGLVALLALALAVGIFRTMLNRLDERIIFLAHHDALTGLINRTVFGERAKLILDGTAPGSFSGMLLLDLDRFKEINDTHGHKSGDAVIKCMAARLTTVLGAEVPVCRLGGDEFVVMLGNLATAEDCEQVARKVLAAMREPFTFDSSSFCATASIGVALAPLHAQDLEDLMVAADLALYAAKARGRNCIKLFEQEMMEQSLRRAHVEQQIRHALANRLFTLDYQPQFEKDGRKLCGFEALLRLRTEAGENISPGEIIPVAEQTKLILDIGAWAIRTACEAAVAWPAQLFVAVNVSPIELAESDVASVVAEALKATGLAPQRLEIEITEGALLEPSPAVLEQLRRLQEMKVSIAIDDFGSGYSGINYLWRFAFDKLKLDRSLTSGVEDSSHSLSKVFKGIVSIGHDLNLKVAAEGVETASQQAMLTRMGCQVLQGYPLGKPMPQSDLAGFVLRHWQANGGDADAVKVPLRLGGSLDAIRRSLAQVRASSRSTR